MAMNPMEADDFGSHVLDASGLYCPEPIMLLHNKVREVKPGTLIKVVATDPSTQRDVPKFCRFLGHELIEERQNQDRGDYIYLIRTKTDIKEE